MTDPAVEGSPAGIDLTRSVRDEVVLGALDGAEDLLVAELAPLRTVASWQQLEGYVSCSVDGPLQELFATTLYSTLALPLGAADTSPGFCDPLRTSQQRGVLSALHHQGPLTFRVDSADLARRRRLEARIETELSWLVEDGNWAVNLTPGPDGWLAQIGPMFFTRRFTALERRPWSTAPLVAETLVRLAKPQPGDRVLDPFCGVGTLLVAAARSTPDLVLIGSDHDATSIEMARRNLAGRRATLSVASAERLDAEPRSIQRVVSNLPFGKQVGSHGDNERLYPAVLAEVARVLADKGRAVLLTEDKRLLLASVAATTGIKIVKQRVLRYGGATPTAFVISRTRGGR